MIYVQKLKVRALSTVRGSLGLPLLRSVNGCEAKTHTNKYCLLLSTSPTEVRPSVGSMPSAVPGRGHLRMHKRDQVHSLPSSSYCPPTKVINGASRAKSGMCAAVASTVPSQ